MSNRNPTLQSVVNDAVQAGLDEIRVCSPGRVQRYDAATQQVDVQPLIDERHVSEFGEAIVERLPVIPGVPVQFPGGGGFTVTFPIAVGDLVLLVWSAASLDKWLSGAGGNGTIDPETYARHSLGDAVAIPGIATFAAPRASVPTDHVRIGVDGASVQGVGLGAVLRDFLDDFRAWAEAHTHPHAAGPGTTSPPTTPGTPVLPTVPDVESDTVKVTE